MKRDMLGLSKIGLGAWAIGGEYRYGWGPCSSDTALRTIRTAIEVGLNWVDTAPVYGYGHSERVVGIATRHCRDQMFIATKCGLRWNSSDELSRVLTERSIREEIDSSLLRLGIDCLDLVQTHWPDPKTPIEETWSTLSELVRAGKIRYIGACNCDVPSLKRMMTVHPVASVQIPYNILNRDVEMELLPYCQAHAIPVLAYSPMHSGLLAGMYSRGKLAASDWRLRKAEWYGDSQHAKLERVVQILRRWGSSRALTPGQVAIAWVTSNPAVSAAIAGARTPEQAVNNARALTVSLSGAERQQLAFEIDEVVNSPEAMEKRH